MNDWLSDVNGKMHTLMHAVVIKFLNEIKEIKILEGFQIFKNISFYNVATLTNLRDAGTQEKVVKSGIHHFEFIRYLIAKFYYNWAFMIIDFARCQLQLMFE